MVLVLLSLLIPSAAPSFDVGQLVQFRKMTVRFWFWFLFSCSAQRGARQFTVETTHQQQLSFLAPTRSSAAVATQTLEEYSQRLIINSLAPKQDLQPRRCSHHFSLLALSTSECLLKSPYHVQSSSS
jgi:hypothetical protein